MKAHIQLSYRDQKVRSNRGEKHAIVCASVCVHVYVCSLFTYSEHVSASLSTPTAVTQLSELSSNVKLSNQRLHRFPMNRWKTQQKKNKENSDCLL